MRAGSTVVLRKGAGRAGSVEVTRARLPDPLTRDEVFARGLKIAVGQPLPDLALKTVAGAQTSMRKNLRAGRRTLVNVWATWCVPCATEMPELERLRPLLAARRIDLVGLNVDTAKGADVRGFVAARRVRYPVVLGGVAAAEGLYRTEELSVPMSILVDERGVVREIIAGWSERTQARLRALAAGEAGTAAGEN
jgi:thiol-disulfide isomerase/thioredoxin